MTSTFTLGDGKVLIINTKREKYDDIKNDILLSNDNKENIYFIINKKKRISV